MCQLKLAPCPRLINRKRYWVLGPSQNSDDVNFLRSAAGDGDMLRSMTVIGSIWL
jgi:hypothetical protein